jgi:hypothetical protein
MNLFLTRSKNGNAGAFPSLSAEKKLDQTNKLIPVAASDA